MAPRLHQDHSGATSDWHLVQLWLSGRPERTQIEYERDAVRFLDTLSNGLQNATVDDVVSFVSTLKGAPSTIAKSVSVVKSLLSFGHKTGYLVYNVGLVVKPPAVPKTVHERIMDEEDVRLMVKYAGSTRDRILIRLLYLSGARISEAIGLRWKDVENGRLHFFGKGSKTRTIVVPEALTEELRSLRGPSDEGSDPVFRTVQGNPLTTRQAQRRIAQTAERAGLEVSPHWFRHSHATHAIEKGAKIHVVQQTLGHASVATTGTYLHVRPTQGSAQFLSC